METHPGQLVKERQFSNHEDWRFIIKRGKNHPKWKDDIIYDRAMKKEPSADQGDDSCDIDGFGLFPAFALLSIHCAQKKVNSATTTAVNRKGR